MGSEEQGQSQVLLTSSSSSIQSFISGLHDKHHRELQNLSLATQPLKTLKFFVLAIIDFVRQQVAYISSKRRWFLLGSFLVIISGILVRTVFKPNEEYFLELHHYLHFGIWWLALGVASSIGLGSGLHTFVLYLGPHIALFTLKCVKCGHVDIKSAPYDTIQFGRGPSWLDKDCSELGPTFVSSTASRVPLSSILHQVQLEAMLWGVGTALGELPPYFISRAAYLSGRKLEVMENADTATKEHDTFIDRHLNHLKKWLLMNSEHLNFLTILVLASVPNPLFDLAGIMCGQLGIPFWKFFSATVIGKAIVKTHIQSCFIISVCNNQLLDLIENEFLWVMSLVPGVASVLPKIVAKLHFIRQKYMEASPLGPSTTKGKKWDISLASVWNTIVVFILINFLVKIINGTAQGLMKKHHQTELDAIENVSDD